MEEEGGLKAPLTRLRRRLSVEQGEDAKSPATPSTPTKKRGRLAAKPQLDLIDENTTISSPKKATKKGLAVAAVENEELPLTPARRSTRIKSNTSIISETAQTFDSPRAKRSLRRTSQIGSDNEAPLTPARVTRRTRKDSTSSVENQVDSTSTLAIKQTNEVITEEPDTDSRNVISSSEAANNKSKNGSPTPRKSPRLLAKKHRRSSSVISDESICEKSQERTEANVNKSPVTPKGEKQTESISETSQKKDDTIKKTPVALKEKNESFTKVSPPIYIIPPSENLKKSIKPKRLNKSTPNLEDNNDIKSKRYRTKSWTTSSTNLTQDSYFCSDNESNKIKIKESGKDKSAKLFNEGSASGDRLLNVSKDLNKLEQKCLSKDSFNERQDADLLNKSHSKNADEEKVNDINKDNAIDNEKIISETEKLFEQAPSANLNPLVFIEDSDSNTDSTSKLVIVEKQSDCEDQCVPVVEHSTKNEIKNKLNFSFNKNKETEPISCFNTSVKISNDSCEPMDIDETLPEDILKNNVSNNKSSFNNSLTQKELSTMKNNTSHDKSKRKFSLSDTTGDSEKNNKSTLILSELKDLSNLTKSPISDEKIEDSKKSKRKSSISKALSDSQTVAFSKIANDSVEINKSGSISKNKSLSKSFTSTPLNKKTIETLGMQTSTPVLLSLKDKLPVAKISVQNTDVLSQNGDDSDSSDAENEESLKSNSLIDDEAEEASDDYESGDSQDEEERQYEKENEIVGKGETLTSEDDYTNDSDYEKDSFIVSSDEEDNELLSGSGDDLSMTNNELSMSKDSKQKYNKRKLKEQKKASREMYAARHGLNSSKVSKSSNSQFDSSESESEETLPKKKSNRLRLDSSKLESSVGEADADESIVAKKKKTKRLSESICNENDVEETEIHAVPNDTHDLTNDPLSVAVKSEPKTPQKDISHINFTVREELEEVNFNENMTIDQVNETSDPLDDGDEADSSSDDEDKAQIINNYDSVLNELNKTSKVHVKSHDLSLNINKKSKGRVNKSVIDNLNLTQPKSSDKKIYSNVVNSPKQAQLKDKTRNKNIEIKINDEESSDSIDMHLLFPSDSEASTDDIKNPKNKANNTEETLISLKRTPGKTNILDLTDNGVDDTANISLNKKKNRKSLLNKSKEADNDEGNDAEVSFFVDTVGDHNDSEKQMKSQKKRKSSVSNKPTELISTHDSDDDAPLEISFKIEKNKEAMKNNLEDEQTTLISGNNTNVTPRSNQKQKRKSGLNVLETQKPEILLKTPQSQKKVKNISTSESVNIQDNSVKTPQSQKKNKKLSTSEPVDIEDNSVKTPQSQKKNKKLSTSEHIDIEDHSVKTPQSHKKNKKLSTSEPIDIEDHSVKTPQSHKKNKKLSTSEPVDIEDNSVKTPQSQKKNKKLSTSDPVDIQDNSVKTPQSQKKSKKLFTSEPTDIQDNSVKTPQSQKKNKKLSTSEPVDIRDNSVKTPQSQKKNKAASKSESTKIQQALTKSPLDQNRVQNLETQVAKADSENQDKNKSKKRKRNTNPGVNNVVLSEGATDDPLVHNKNKKLKTSIKEVDSSKTLGENRIANQEGTLKLKKSNNDEKSIVKEEVSKGLIGKKRKYNDDGEENVVKIPKEHYLDTVHVHRLPNTFLKQLDEKPSKKLLKMKKAKVVATANFVVEEPTKRKNKPSNYLEESVYLNDDNLPVKKSKGKLKNPKVLPFMPTATLSDKGFTTTFKVNVIPKEVQFVAQSSNVSNFKNKYMFGKQIKRSDTYEMYKKQRNIKLSKF